MRARLSFDRGGQTNEVSLPPVYTIGRSESCDLVLDHMFVSNLHCSFLVEPHGVAVVDHESSNGTLVNGVRARGKALLRSGDVVEVGPHAFTLLLVADTVTPGASTAVRPALMLNLGVQRSTFTDQVAVSVRPMIEAVESPKRRTCFHDVVKAKDGAIVIVVLDFPSEPLAEEIAELRRLVRSPVHGNLRALTLALEGSFDRLKRTASPLLVRVEPSTGAIAYTTVEVPPALVRKGQVHRLDPSQRDATMMIGDVLVVGSRTVAGILEATEQEPALQVREARTRIASVWLGSQLAKASNDGCAVLLEIVGG